MSSKSLTKRISFDDGDEVLIMKVKRIIDRKLGRWTDLKTVELDAIGSIGYVAPHCVSAS